MAESTAYGMDVGMREGSGLSTWVDSGAIYGDQVTGRQVWRVGSGPVNKKVGTCYTFVGPGDHPRDAPEQAVACVGTPA